MVLPDTHEASTAPETPCPWPAYDRAALELLKPTNPDLDTISVAVFNPDCVMTLAPERWMRRKRENP